MVYDLSTIWVLGNSVRSCLGALDPVSDLPASLESPRIDRNWYIGHIYGISVDPFRELLMTCRQF